MTVRQSHAVEERVRAAVQRRRKEVREVKIHVHGEDHPWPFVMSVNAEGATSEEEEKSRQTDFAGCEPDETAPATPGQPQR